MPSPYFERDGVALYHGDARELVADLEPGSAHLLLTDPPYGMSYKSTTGASIRGDSGTQAIRAFRSTLRDVDRALADDAHAYVFCHWASYPDVFDAIAPYWQLKNALIWDKRNHGPGDCFGDYGHDYEIAIFAHKGRRKLNGGRDLAVRHEPTVPYRQRTHATQKPIELLAYYVEKSSHPGELVLDPFAGSSAVLHAAIRTGRRAVGIELDERHCESAAELLDADLTRRAAGDVGHDASHPAAARRDATAKVLRDASSNQEARCRPPAPPHAGSPTFASPPASRRSPAPG